MELESCCFHVTFLPRQVHRWVNYESMLKECLVGRMAMKPPLPKGTWIQG